MDSLNNVPVRFLYFVFRPIFLTFYIVVFGWTAIYRPVLNYCINLKTGDGTRATRAKRDTRRSGESPSTDSSTLYCEHDLYKLNFIC